MNKHWGETIRKLRQERDWSQALLARKSAITRSALVRYELGMVKKLNPELLVRFAIAFDMTPAQLSQEMYGKIPENLKALGITAYGETANIPIIGRVPCGQLDVREETSIGHLTVALKELRGISTEGLYILIADGESLAGDNIHDGYNLLFNVNNTEIINGKTYIVRYDGQVTAKHVYKEHDKVILRPSNPAYEDIVLPIKETMPVEIIGRVVKAVNSIDM